MIPGYLILGILAGILSGLIGIGGGIVIIPALVMLFKFNQHLAQGTTLALMVPPIGLLAAYTYYRNGYLDIKAAAFIACGFIAGSLLGSRFAMAIPKELMSKIFGVVLILIGFKMLLWK